MTRAIEDVYEYEYIDLSSEEIDLLDDDALKAIDDFNDREYERFLRELDEAIKWTGSVRG